MKKTKSFTMIEVLITTFLISIGLLTVFEVINYAKRINQRVAEMTIANQLATEGAEIIYQIRNTNFIKYENAKQKYIAENCDDSYDNCISEFKTMHNINRCWLALNYEECIAEPTTYTGYLGTGCYYITNIEGKNILNEYTDSSCETGIMLNEFSICLNSGTRTPCIGGHDDGSDESTYGKYYRSIIGQGVFDMSTTETGGTMLNIDDLPEKLAQEYRFCSYVSRQSLNNGSIEICSTMTNFID